MIRLFLALCLALLTAPALAGPPADAVGRVSKVSIHGTERIEDATVLAAMTLRRGDQISASRVRRDLRAIYATGYFDDIRFESVTTDDGIELVVFVKEKPAVRDVLIEGEKKIKEEDIREVLDIRSFAVLNEAVVRQNIDRIRDLYVEKGFYLVDIKDEVKWVTDDQVELTFRITENKKVIVQRVQISGNDSVPTNKIRRFMQLKQGGVVPWLSNAGTFRRELLEADKQTIGALYWEEGYLDVQVDPPDVFLSPDKKYIFVNHHVTEGQRYKIGSVKIEGDFVPDEGLSEENVRAILNGKSVIAVQEKLWREQEGKKGARLNVYARGAHVKAGDWYKYSTVAMIGMAIEQFYQDQGYAQANANPIPFPNPETGVADVVYRIEKGKKYRIGRINITGNDPTLDKVVRRELKFEEGALYRGGRIQASRARIQRLGYFDEVNISTPKGDGDDVLDVNIQVNEQPTGSFSLGLGFSNLESFVFTANVSKNNFLGMGYVMSASVNWSRVRQQWQLQFFDPYFLDSRWTMRLNGYNITRKLQLDEYQRGGSVEIGRYLDHRDDWRIALEYTFEDVGLTSISRYLEHMIGGDLYRNGLTSTIGLALNLDKRNNRIKATKGVYASASVALSGGFRVGGDKVLSLLGGDFNFVETKFNMRFYQPLIPKTDLLVFRYNLTLGHIQSTDGSVIPFIHRYRAGGINSLRGFNWYSLGPTLRSPQSDDPIRRDDQLIIGGTSTWINNVEIEMPVVRQAGIALVVFFDAGNAFGDAWGNGFINPLNLRTSVGAGVRWQSPIGPLRFEWGFPLKPEEGERKSVFDFSIGSFF